MSRRCQDAPPVARLARLSDQPQAISHSTLHWTGLSRPTDVHLMRPVLSLIVGTLVVACSTPSPTATPAEMTAQPSAPAPSPSEESSPSPRLTPWPTISPSLVLADRITCGDGTPGFAPAALNGPPVAETATDPPGLALWSFIQRPSIAGLPAPSAGWRRVFESPTKVLFVASAVDGSWRYLLLESTGVGDSIAGWYASLAGDCRLQVSFADSVARADLWLDPAHLPAPADRVVRLFLAETACAGGQSPEGRILAPEVRYRADGVFVSIGVRRLRGSQDCLGRDADPHVVQLSESVGNRQLFDASLIPPRALEPYR